MNPNKDLSRLIILSDLWGFQNCQWIGLYEKALSKKFNVSLHDCRELGQVDLKSNSQQMIHSQFVGGGIDKAVENLIAQEQEEVHVLGFSVGGTIAWQAVTSGLKALSLTAVSATRLRHEKESIPCKLALYFGENDEYKPSQDWAVQLAVKLDIIDGYGHHVYSEPESIQRIVSELIDREAVSDTQL